MPHLARNIELKTFKAENRQRVLVLNKAGPSGEIAHGKAGVTRRLRLPGRAVVVRIVKVAAARAAAQNNQAVFIRHGVMIPNIAQTRLRHALPGKAAVGAAPYPVRRGKITAIHARRVLCVAAQSVKRAIVRHQCHIAAGQIRVVYAHPTAAALARYHHHRLVVVAARQRAQCHYRAVQLRDMHVRHCRQNITDILAVFAVRIQTPHRTRPARDRGAAAAHHINAQPRRRRCHIEGRQHRHRYVFAGVHADDNRCLVFALAVCAREQCPRRVVCRAVARARAARYHRRREKVVVKPQTRCARIAAARRKRPHRADNARPARRRDVRRQTPQLRLHRYRQRKPEVISRRAGVFNYHRLHHRVGAVCHRGKIRRSGGVVVVNNVAVQPARVKRAARRALIHPELGNKLAGQACCAASRAHGKLNGIGKTIVDASHAMRRHAARPRQRTGIVAVQQYTAAIVPNAHLQHGNAPLGNLRRERHQRLNRRREGKAHLRRRCVAVKQPRRYRVQTRVQCRVRRQAQTRALNNGLKLKAVQSVVDDLAVIRAQAAADRHHRQSPARVGAVGNHRHRAVFNIRRRQGRNQRQYVRANIVHRFRAVVHAH